MAETEMVRAVRKSERVVLPDRLSLDQAKQSLVEGLEPFARALLDGLTDRLQLAPPDQRLDAGGDEQDLNRRRPALALRPGNEPLRDHGAQGERQLEN
jgi:hypothetical protein